MGVRASCHSKIAVEAGGVTGLPGAPPAPMLGADICEEAGSTGLLRNDILLLKLVRNALDKLRGKG